MPRQVAMVITADDRDVMAKFDNIERRADRINKKFGGGSGLPAGLTQSEARSIEQVSKSIQDIPQQTRMSVAEARAAFGSGFSDMVKTAKVGSREIEKALGQGAKNGAKTVADETEKATRKEAQAIPAIFKTLEAARADYVSSTVKAVEKDTGSLVTSYIKAGAAATKVAEETAKKETKIAEDAARAQLRAFTQATEQAAKSAGSGGLNPLERAALSRVAPGGRLTSTGVNELSKFNAEAQKSQAILKAVDPEFRAFLGKFNSLPSEAEKAAFAAEHFGGDVSKLMPQLQAAASQLGEVETAAGAAGGGLAAMAGPVGIAVAAVALLVAGIAALVYGIFKAASSFADYAKGVHDVEAETGLTAKTVSTLSTAVDFLSNTSMASVNTAIVLYLKNLSEAAHNNPAVAKTFQRFGADAKKAIEDPDRAVRDLLNHLAAIPNSAERLDEATKLAGRGGKALADVAERMREMGGSFDEFQKKAQEWGVILSEDDVRAADEFRQSMTIMGEKVEGVVYHLGRDVMPELKKAIDDIGAALGTDLLDWDRWGMAIAVKIARVRGAAEGFAKWWHGNTWSPQELGKQVEQSANDAEVNTVADWIMRQRKAAQDGRGHMPGGVGDVIGHRKSGAAAARRAAQLMLESAQIDLRDAESVYREGNAIAKRALDLNLNDFDEYSKRRTELENDRYGKEKAVFAREVEALNSLTDAQKRAGLGQIDDLVKAAKPGSLQQQQLVKLKDILQREQAALRDHNDKGAEITTEGLQHDFEIRQKFAQADVTILQEQFKTEDIEMARALDRRTKTYEDATNLAVEEAAKLAGKQGDMLQNALIHALGGEESAKGLSDTISEVMRNAVNAEDVQSLEDGFKEILSKAANPAAVQEALNNIKAFFLQRKAAYAQNNRDVHDSRVKDLEDFRAFNRAELVEANNTALDKLNGQLRKLRAEAADDQLTEQRRLLQAKAEEVGLTQEIMGLQDQLATQGVNASLRYERAWLSAIKDVREADISAVESQIQSQVKLADATVFHSEQARAIVLGRLASEKSVTESFAGAITDAYDTITGAVARGISKITGGVQVLDNLLASIINRLISRVFQRFLDAILPPAGGQSVTGSGAGTSLLNVLFGRGGSGGYLTGGYAGGNPAAVLTSGGAVGGSLAQALGLGISAPTSNTELAAGLNLNHELAHALSLGSSGGAAAKGFSLSGLAGSAAAMAPLLGLSLGAGLGGGGLGSILGGAGGLLLGGTAAALLAPGLFGVVPGAMTVAGSSSAAFMSGLYTLLTNPFTIAAGGALLAAAFIISKNKQRQHDETIRNAAANDLGSTLWKMIDDVRFDRTDGAQALSQVPQLEGQYRQAIAGIKDGKTRDHALKWLSQDEPKIVAILAQAANAQLQRKAIESKLAPEFAMGGDVAAMFSILKPFTGRVPGLYDARDDKLIRVSGAEVVINPAQRARLRLTDGQLASAGVPGFQGGGPVGAGGGGTTPISVTLNASITFDGKKFILEALDSPEGHRVQLNVLGSEDAGKVIARRQAKSRLHGRQS